VIEPRRSPDCLAVTPLVLGTTDTGSFTGVDEGSAPSERTDGQAAHFRDKVAKKLAAPGLAESGHLRGCHYEMLRGGLA
jgi:hypothetical protein